MHRLNALWSREVLHGTRRNCHTQKCKFQSKIPTKRSKYYTKSDFAATYLIEIHTKKNEPFYFIYELILIASLTLGKELWTPKLPPNIIPRLLLHICGSCFTKTANLLPSLNPEFISEPSIQYNLLAVMSTHKISELTFNRNNQCNHLLTFQKLRHTF